MVSCLMRMCRATFGLDKTERGTSKSREGVSCKENSLARRMNDLYAFGEDRLLG